MAPRFLYGVIRWDQVTTYRTRESSSALKVNIDIKSFELFGKSDAAYLPGEIDAKSKAEKFFWLHDENLWVRK
jgi:uncharacterized protein YdaL